MRRRSPGSAGAPRRRTARQRRPPPRRWRRSSTGTPGWWAGSGRCCACHFSGPLVEFPRVPWLQTQQLGAQFVQRGRPVPEGFVLRGVTEQGSVPVRRAEGGATSRSANAAAPRGPPGRASSRGTGPPARRSPRCWARLRAPAGRSRSAGRRPASSGRTTGSSARSILGRIGSRSVGWAAFHGSNCRNSSGQHWNPPWSGLVSFRAMMPWTRCGSTPSVVSTSQWSSMSNPLSVGAISARSRFLTLGGLRLSRSRVTQSSSQSHTSTNAS